ncbi:MAG: nucleotidyltransferase family protein [Minisyncoccota bacterium]
MQAVILAAGRGTRMKTLTEHTPKPMILLHGKPILEWKLSMLPVEIDEVIVVIGYLGEQISTYFGNEWQGRRMRYVSQVPLDGTGKAMMLIRSMIRNVCVVMMGDDLYHRDDIACLTKQSIAVLGFAVTDAQQYGLLETDTTGHLMRITERPHGRTAGLVNTGAYLLNEYFFSYPLVKISETEYGLPQTLALLAQDIPVTVLRARAWQPVGTPEDIVSGEAFLIQYVL